MLEIPKKAIITNSLGKFPINIQRFLNPNISCKGGIFHSTYYRIINDPSIINVTTVHDFTYEYYRKGLPGLLHQYQKGAAINNSKKIICVSENTKRDLISFYPKINDKKIKVIYNGVNTAYKILDNNPGDLVKSLVPYSQGEYILYVGERRVKYKNFRLAVEACRILRMPIVMVGGGPVTDQEKSFMKFKLEKNNFFFHPHITNESLNILYNNAFCLLYPSSHEGFGIPIIEAQKSGCPVICSSCSSIPEVAGNGALYLKKIDTESIIEAIKTIDHNSAKRNEIIHIGIKNANKFSWDQCYQQTKELYEELYHEN